MTACYASMRSAAVLAVLTGGYGLASAPCQRYVSTGQGEGGLKSPGYGAGSRVGHSKIPPLFESRGG